MASSLVGLLTVAWVGRKIFLTQRNRHLKNPYGASGRLLRDPKGAAAAMAAGLAGSEKSVHQFRHALHKQFSGSNKNDEAQVLQDVLAAKLQLIDLTVVEEELLRAPANSYAGVYGKFCKIDWTVRKKDPSAVPMFRHLVAASQDCDDSHYTLDLKKVVDLARYQDQANGATSTSSKSPKVLNFTLATFHESRCGSTLVANAVAAMDPVKHRSYSEAQPPAAALTSVCGRNFSRCSLQQAALVLRDTLYLMSRSDDPKEERVFFKFQSATTKNIQIFQEAFPDQPWIFVYRDPVQVMMSHIKDDPELKGRANCLRSKSSPPPEIKEIAARHGISDPRLLSMEEYCAAHLASITESAASSLTDISMPVNYETLPDSLHESILPTVLGRPLTQQEVENIRAISQNYSKGTGGRHKEFQDDSEAKTKAASPAVKEAAAKFLKPSFDRLSQHRPKIFSP